MTVHETVTRESQSYRQGLVLGLTLAEVMLLLVFALLIAMAVLWRAEHDERMKLAESLPAWAKSDVKKQLFGEVAIALVDTKPGDSSRVIDAIKKINGGQELEPVNRSEKQFIVEERRQFAKQPARAIDDDWRVLTRAVQNIGDLEKRLDIAESVMKAPSSAKKGEHDWPPIITLSADYSFQRGSTELTPQFESEIHGKIIQDLLRTARDYQVDVIEVVGHTDELPISARTSNLDADLLPVLGGKAQLNSLIPADNAGLGLARAVAIVSALEKDGRLNQFRILPLSGAQLIQTDQTLSKGTGPVDDPKRRRIEIRMRKYTAARPPAEPEH